MFIFVYIGGIALVGVILLKILQKLTTGTSLSDRIKEELDKKKKTFCFNGAIRSYSVAFIKLGIASSIQIMMQVSGSPYVKEGERVKSNFIFSCLVASVPVFYAFNWYS